MSVGERFQELLADNRPEKKETRRTTYILRVNSVIMCVYFLAILLAFFRMDSLFIPACAIPCFLAYIFLFYLTYLDRTRAALIFQEIISLIFVALFVYMYGWWCGVQHFIFAMVVLTCVVSDASVLSKTVKGMLLCLYRLALYFYTGCFAPAVDVPEQMGVYFQVINSAAIFAVIIVCLNISAMDTGEMQKTLELYGEKDRLAHRLDQLTGLWNRRAMCDYLYSAVRELPGVERKKLCLAAADLDGLRKINEKYGHSCGDVILKQIAHQMEKFMDGKGTVARWDGDTFLLVLEDLGGEDAYYQLTMFQRQFRDQEFTYHDESLHLTMTYGLVEYTCEGNVDSNVLEAEKKMHLGKQSGRNTIIF